MSATDLRNQTKCSDSSKIFRVPLEQALAQIVIDRLNKKLDLLREDSVVSAKKHQHQEHPDMQECAKSGGITIASWLSEQLYQRKWRILEMESVVPRSKACATAESCAHNLADATWAKIISLVKGFCSDASKSKLSINHPNYEMTRRTLTSICDVISVKVGRNFRKPASHGFCAHQRQKKQPSPQMKQAFLDDAKALCRVLDQTMDRLSDAHVRANALDLELTDAREQIENLKVQLDEKVEANAILKSQLESKVTLPPGHDATPIPVFVMSGPSSLNFTPCQPVCVERSEIAEVDTLSHEHSDSVPMSRTWRTLDSALKEHLQKSEPGYLDPKTSSRSKNRVTTDIESIYLSQWESVDAGHFEYQMNSVSFCSSPSTASLVETPNKSEFRQSDESSWQTSAVTTNGSRHTLPLEQSSVDTANGSRHALPLDQSSIDIANGSRHTLPLEQSSVYIANGSRNALPLDQSSVDTTNGSRNALPRDHMIFSGKANGLVGIDIVQPEHLNYQQNVMTEHSKNPEACAPGAAPNHSITQFTAPDEEGGTPMHLVGSRCSKATRDDSPNEICVRMVPSPYRYPSSAVHRNPSAPRVQHPGSHTSAKMVPNPTNYPSPAVIDTPSVHSQLDAYFQPCVKMLPISPQYPPSAVNRVAHTTYMLL